MTLYHDSPGRCSCRCRTTRASPPGAFSDARRGRARASSRCRWCSTRSTRSGLRSTCSCSRGRCSRSRPSSSSPSSRTSAPAPVVRPGGIGLDVRAGTRPLIAARHAGGGPAGRPGPHRRGLHRARSRRVDVGGVEVRGGRRVAGRGAGGSPLLLSARRRRPRGARASGAQPLTVRAAGLVSRRGALRVAAAARARRRRAGRAPPRSRRPTSSSTGANLADAQEARALARRRRHRADRRPRAARRRRRRGLGHRAVGRRPRRRARAAAAPWRLTLRVGAQRLHALRPRWSSTS